MKLNDKQRKMVEDNHNLIYFCLHNNKLSLNDIEDWYGVASIGLCRAAYTYDETRGVKFSSYAVKCINNEIYCVLRKKKCETISLREELISDDTNFESEIEEIVSLRDMYLKVCESLSKREKQILNTLINYNLSQTEVASMYGISRQRVNIIYNELLNKLKSMAQKENTAIN